MELQPGSPISENEIATELGVSRTPVREALLLLASQELVEVYSRRATFITRLDPFTIQQAQFFRESVEVWSMLNLTGNLNGRIMTEIDQNLERQEETLLSDTEEFFQLDEEFHRLLLALGGHYSAWEVVSSQKVHLDRARLLGLRQRLDNRPFFKNHCDIFDAVRQRDFDSAAELLTHHLRVVLDDIKSAQNAYPHVFA